MRSIVALLSFTVLIPVSCKSVNYCGSKMCRNTNTHTFCQYHPGPGPECTGYIPAPLSKDEKVRIMVRLNRRRNEAAMGRLRGLPSAGNMLKLRWVEELAREAQLWADQCRPPAMPEKQDICRDLYSTTVGQCVSSVVGEAPGLRVESMIDMWYMQSLMYKGNVTTYVASPTSGGYYGDFGQMLWSRAYMVGCGRSRFMTSLQERLRSVERLVCNIAPRGPVPGRPLWTPALPASICPPRSVPDEFLKGLCNFHPELDETQDVDNSFTLEEHIILNTILDFERNSSLDIHGNLDKMFLTRLAVVTLVNPMITSMYYNSMQNRDIVEFIESEKMKNDLANITEELVQNKNETKCVGKPKQGFDQNMTKTATKSLKKLKLVGRPKTYIIEELTDNTAEISTENNYQKVTEDVVKLGELFDDYSFLDVQDDNMKDVGILVTKFAETMVEHEIVTTTTAHIVNVSTAEKQELTKNISNISTVGASLENINISRNDIYFMSTKNESVDYLDDPETVRLLQEALQRMEQTMETSILPSQVKVRRALKGYTTEDLPELEDIKITPKYLPPDLEAINKTFGRGPVMNMMMKYVPYLKESNILMPSSKGSFVGPHIILFILFICLV